MPQRLAEPDLDHIIENRVYTRALGARAEAAGAALRTSTQVRNFDATEVSVHRAGGWQHAARGTAGRRGRGEVAQVRENGRNCIAQRSLTINTPWLRRCAPNLVTARRRGGAFMRDGTTGATANAARPVLHRLVDDPVSAQQLCDMPGDVQRRA